MNNEIRPQKPAYKTEAQAVAMLEELELKTGLYKYRIDDYSAWRLLRFKMSLVLQHLPFSSSSKSSRFTWAMERLVYFFREIPVFLFPQHKNILVKTFSTALGEEENGFYKDIHFDDLFDGSDTCFKIEALNNPNYAERREKALIPITMTTAVFDLLSAAFAFIKIPTYTRRVASDIYRDIQSEFDGLALTAKGIQVSLLMFYWSKRLYKWLLFRIKPKIVLSADTGEFSLWAASRELGIPVVEFQHGIFTRGHPDALNSTMGAYRNHLIIPNKIFLYGEYWRKQLLLNQYYQGELVTVGNPRIDRYRAIRKNILTPDSNSDTSILLTSQGLDLERLIEFLSEFVYIANSKLKYSLCIKLHPAERDRSIYVKTLGKYPLVKILYGFEKPSTFELFAKADLHISIASASHYDSIGLFVPTVVLPLAGHELVQHLVDEGHAHLVKTPKDLVDLASNIRDLKVTEEVSHYYYEPNALQNIKREMGRLI